MADALAPLLESATASAFSGNPGVVMAIAALKADDPKMYAFWNGVRTSIDAPVSSRLRVFKKMCTTTRSD